MDDECLDGTMLELWALSLRDVKASIRPLFTQVRVAASAGLFLDGLLGPERRKTGWMRAEAAGDPGPWRQRRCCIDRRGGRLDPNPVCIQAIRTEFGRPSSGMRLRTWTATLTSVA